MKIIPAIDIQNGNCVRLKQGDFSQETIFNHSPLEIAEKWVKDGAQRLHIVDLDGARLGSPINIELISKICKTFPNVPIQIGGGIRNLETARKYINAGASFIIIGTKAVEDSDFVKDLCSEFHKKIIIGIDAKNGEVATEGWVSNSKVNAISLSKKFEDFGVSEIVYTDIEKDGMMKGLNIKATVDLAKEINIPVIASGGVSSNDDLKKINGYKKFGISGVIIGRALYENKINIKEAQEILRNMKNVIN